MKKISIITPSFNQGHFIEQTILSVLEQGYPYLEYVIIDGASTDQTLEIIKKYERHISYWVSEKDKGQANAINKGLKLCTGEIFNWLNSDDYLAPGALLKIGAAFEDVNVTAVAGQVRNFSDDAEDIVLNQHLSSKGLMCWEKNVQFNQPGVWLRTKMVEYCGGVDEQFHYSFDWDLLIRYLYHFPHVSYLNELLVNFRLHRASKTVSAHNKFLEEEVLIIENIYQNETFKKLHPVCAKKINRANWTGFLTSQINDDTHTKMQRVYSIVKHLSEHPKESGVSRMTLGAIKKIILSQAYK